MTSRFRQRRNAFRPEPEGLEPRIALSSAQIGINLDGNYWGDGSPIWTDLRNQSTGWSATNGSTLALTADGYPLADASTSFDAIGYPSGDYQFSYTGSGTLSFTGGSQIVGPVTTTNGVTTGTIQVNIGPNAYIQMQATGIDPSNPMDNFHLMMPGYGNGTTPEPMFTPDFLRALQPFSDIRFLNWTVTNNSTLANWSDRVQPNAFLSNGPGGVPYEDMIELCNEAQKDMWINIPALATPQFVQSLAQLIDSQLDPNLNVYFEYSNEIWNGGFDAYYQVATIAASNPVLDQSLGQYQLVAQQAAYTTVQDAQIFDQVFGSGASRVRPILGGQESYDAFQTDELQFIQQEFGPPSQYIYAQAVAPYASTDQSLYTPGMTLDQLFSYMQEYVSNHLTPNLDSDGALDQQYGVPMVAYEGGQGLTPGFNNPNYAVLQQAQTDPRMAGIYTQMMLAWEQAGGSLFNAFTLTGSGSVYGFWGMLPDVTYTGSTKYDAFVESSYPFGDANTVLTAGQSISSPNGQYQLIMQSDGNLVVYGPGSQAIWDSGTYGNPGASAIMQGDGNLVVYSSAGTPLWNSGTYGNPGAYFRLQDNGEAVIYQASGTALWYGNSTAAPAAAPGRVLTAGQAIYSPDGQYQLIMQGDGNLVEYAPGDQAIWNSGTYGNPGAYAIMQTDGNLVVYSSAGTPLWYSGTYGNPGASLVLADGGALEIFNQGWVIWSV
jgi:hypothetical protein